MGMSPAALARCRQLSIDPGSEPGLTVISVYDPRLKRKVASQMVRTPQDLARYKRAWMSKFRIPAENVTDNTEAQPEASENPDAGEA